MSRVALVTGGTRGIGAAISVGLKAAGYTVAANYAGNDEAAAAFKAETGVPVYKWDVSSYEACADGVRKVEVDLGPIEVLVNNAGITRDVMFHKMTPQQWREVIDTNLSGLFNMTHPVWGGMRDRGFGRIVNISSINGQKGQMGIILAHFNDDPLPEGKARYGRVVVVTTDAQAVAKRATDAGGTARTLSAPPGGSVVIFVSDPDGYQIELYQPAAPAAANFSHS